MLVVLVGGGADAVPGGDRNVELSAAAKYNIVWPFVLLSANSVSTATAAHGRRYLPAPMLHVGQGRTSRRSKS